MDGDKLQSVLATRPSRTPRRSKRQSIAEVMVPRKSSKCHTSTPVQNMGDEFSGEELKQALQSNLDLLPDSDDEDSTGGVLGWEWDNDTVGSSPTTGSHHRTDKKQLSGGTVATFPLSDDPDASATDEDDSSKDQSMEHDEEPHPPIPRSGVPVPTIYVPGSSVRKLGVANHYLHKLLGARKLRDYNTFEKVVTNCKRSMKEAKFL